MIENEKIRLTVRLSAETKTMIEELKRKKDNQLKEQIKSGLINNLEKTLLDRHGDLLNGLSLSIDLNVTISSIIELAYYETKNNTSWGDIIKLLKDEEENLPKVNTGLTPKIFISKEVLNGLEEYAIEFKKFFPEAQRSVKLIYIIKIVIFRYYMLEQDQFKEKN